MLDLLMALWTKSKTVTTLVKKYRYKNKKDHADYIDVKTRKAILRDFFKLAQQHIIDGKNYNAPEGMGSFRVVKFKEKVKRRNFAEEKKFFKENGYWKVLKYQNFHTGGYKVEIKWFTHGYKKLPLRKIFEFQANKPFRKALAYTILKDGNIDKYYQTGRKTRLETIKTLI